MTRISLAIILPFMVFTNGIPALFIPHLQGNSLYEVNPHGHLTNQNLQTPANFGAYVYGYDVEDSKTANVQYKREERHENGSVTGSYGYLQPDGNVQKVSYIADKFGYRASVEITPRGFLKPIQHFRPETHLLDFSSNLPPYRKAKMQVPIYKQLELTDVVPHNVPNYITKHLDNPKYRLEKGFVPYFPENQRKELYQNILKDYYIIPFQ